MKIKKLLPTLFIIFTFSCDTTEPPPPPPSNGTTIYNTIILSVQWTDLYRINVKWNRAKADTLEPFTYRLTQTDEQGNKTTKEFIIAGKDTSHTAGEPDSLSQGKSYWFKVEGFNSEGKLKDTSRTAEGKTLSPTSHDIVWQIDTLGQPGNFLYDVWGLDENNVYAVGFVDLPEGSSGIIKWDGTKWNPFPASLGVKYGIFGFSESSIFVVGESSNRGFAGIWNGSEWTTFFSDYFYSRGDTVYPLRATWGSSPEDVWAVGDLGTIIHWDGFEWKKENNVASSFGQYEFLDIWGFDENEIYAAGRMYQDSVLLLKYNGTSWQPMIRQASLVVNATVWGPHKDLLYFIEYNKYRIVNGTAIQFTLPGQTATIEKIRGSGVNNIFTVGHFGEVFHFNGITWKKIEELNTPFLESSALRSCYVTDNKVIIVGLTQSRAVFIKGTKQ